MLKLVTKNNWSLIIIGVCLKYMIVNKIKYFFYKNYNNGRLVIN